MNLWGLIKSWFSRKDSLPPGFHMIKRPDGSISIVDQKTIDYMESKAPDPTQKSLDVVLKQLRKVRVYSGGSLGKECMNKEVLIETESDADFNELSEALRIMDEPAGHCMCLGDPTFEFYGEGSKRLAIISLHHGLTIRWDLWKDDAALVDGLRVLNWLAKRGVTYPLDEYEENLRQEEISELNWKRWIEHMPQCLIPFKAEMTEDLGWAVFTTAPDSTNSGEVVKENAGNNEDQREGLDKLQKAMEKAYSDGIERALVLLAWFGNGAGPWSGFPAYEEVADRLILKISKENLISALSRSDLSEAQLEGGARFLTGHEARSFRNSILAQLSDDIKNTFLEHVLHSTDEDKKKRAQGIFSGKK